jgi:hypothetical protein
VAGGHLERLEASGLVETNRVLAGYDALSIDDDISSVGRSGAGLFSSKLDTR